VRSRRPRGSGGRDDELVRDDGVPAKILSYSGLKVACTSDGVAAPSSGLTIHDFNNAVWQRRFLPQHHRNTTPQLGVITSTNGLPLGGHDARR